MPVKIDKAPAASNPDKEVDSKDTSEEEDTEEDTEDQEQGEEEDTSDETDEEDESTEEDDEKVEDEDKVEQHIDLKTVPPQLREAAKRMLASHTKAMQKIPALVENAKKEVVAELQDAYSEVLVKASGFDKIIKLPAWEQFWDDMTNGREYGHSSRFRENGKTKSEDDSSASDDGKVSVQDLVKQLTPALRKMVEVELGPIKKERANALWSDAEKNLPNFKMYKAKVTEILLKYPDMPIEDAYTLAGGRKEAAAKATKDSKEIVKKLPKTLKPGGSGSDRKPLSDKTVNSIEQALALASRDILSSRGG
jgi:hypothetical protein